MNLLMISIPQAFDLLIILHFNQVVNISGNKQDISAKQNNISYISITVMVMFVKAEILKFKLWCSFEFFVTVIV